LEKKEENSSLMLKRFFFRQEKVDSSEKSTLQKKGYWEIGKEKELQQKGSELFLEELREDSADRKNSTSAQSHVRQQPKKRVGRAGS